MIEYHPISPKDQSRRLHQFGKNKIQASSWVVCCVRVSIGKGDIVVRDVEELQNLDARKEVLVPKNDESFTVPVADG